MRMMMMVMVMMMMVVMISNGTAQGEPAAAAATAPGRRTEAGAPRECPPQPPFCRFGVTTNRAARDRQQRGGG